MRVPLPYHGKDVRCSACKLEFAALRSEERPFSFDCPQCNGSICLVMPEQDAVIAITAHTGQMQKELDLVWEKLLSAFRSEALPPDGAEQEKLSHAAKNLTAHPAKQ